MAKRHGVRGEYETAREKHDEDVAALRTYAPAFLPDVLRACPNARACELYERTRTTPEKNHRCVFIAALFHVVLRGRGQRAIAAHFGIAKSTLSEYLLDIDVALRTEKDPVLRIMLRGLSKQLQLEPEWFLLPEKRKRRSRR